jgi:hypothetical protein
MSQDLHIPGTNPLSTERWSQGGGPIDSPWTRNRTPPLVLTWFAPGRYYSSLRRQIRLASQKARSGPSHHVVFLLPSPNRPPALSPAAPATGGRRYPLRAHPASRHRRKVVAAPALVPGPPLVQQPTPTGGVPAADRPALQPASTAGLPVAPTPFLRSPAMEMDPSSPKARSPNPEP